MYLGLELKLHRKFVHGLSHIGKKYEGEGLKKYAIKCYRQVEEVYSSSNWNSVQGWVMTRLAQNLSDLQSFPAAIDCYKIGLKHYELP